MSRGKLLLVELLLPSVSTSSLPSRELSEGGKIIQGK